MSSPTLEIVNSVVLTGSAAVLYTSPIGTWTQIMALTAANIDTATHVATFYIVPSGGSAGTTNISTDAQAILPGANYNGRNEYGQVLNPGDALWGKADAGSVVNVFAS